MFDFTLKLRILKVFSQNFCMGLSYKLLNSVIICNDLFKIILLPCCAHPLQFVSSESFASIYFLTKLLTLLFLFIFNHFILELTCHQSSQVLHPNASKFLHFIISCLLKLASNISEILMQVLLLPHCFINDVCTRIILEPFTFERLMVKVVSITSLSLTYMKVFYFGFSLTRHS